MESPDTKSNLPETSLQSSIIRDSIRNDDSGYVTNTPVSAECTWHSDLSENLSARTPFLHLDSFRGHISTPANTLVKNESRDFRQKPKSLFKTKDFFLEDSSVGESLPTLHEGNVADCKKSLRPSLKRQLAVDKDPYEFSESENHSHHVAAIFSPTFDTEKCVNQLKKLAVEDEKRTNFQSIENLAPPSKNVVKRRANSDPTDYNKSLRSLNSCFVEESLRDNNLDLNTPHTLQDVKYVGTPVKGAKRLKRSTPDELLDRASKTPEKQVCTSSECHSSGHKFVKKLLFESQKLGSPEKYKLLYPTPKPVTPPKKNRSTKIESPKCRKGLYSEQTSRINYVGRQYIDFLKMLKSQRPAILIILDNLSGDDLINVSNVSKCWSEICKSDKAADKRRRKVIQHNERIKENKVVTRSETKCKEKPLIASQSVSLTRRDHLIQIQSQMNIMEGPPPKSRSPPVSPGRRRFNMFCKAASEDKTLKLRSCPRCGRPAKVNGCFAVCSGLTCLHKFCSKCFEKKTPGAMCCQLEAPSPSKQFPSHHGILSKKSRKNLRRL